MDVQLEDALQRGLKQAMRIYPQGVTVATADSPDGPKGITVSSFTSVSLDPPLVLLSIARTSALHDLFAGAKSYAVNLLADDQKSVSDRFAGRTNAKERFEGVKFARGVTGSPVIAGVRAVIECSAWEGCDGGEQSGVVGEVVAAEVINSKRPLVYYSQQYTTTEQMEYPAPPSDFVW